MILIRAIGIDLGTTNSAVAMLDPNERDLVLCKDTLGRSTTPSCVWCDPRTGEVTIGHRAHARRGAMPEPISSIKRSMGTQMTVDFGGEPCSPATISAYILRELKRQIEAEAEQRSSAGLQYDVGRAIITVPAYFGLPAIEATREAGQQAGLDVTELLHEPTAAAIHYSWKHNLGDGTYLVYDLGGGTFDVSILRRTAGEFMVLGISGDNFLGGDDFDRRLAEHLRQILIAEGYELELDVEANAEDRLRFNQLMTLAEKAKKELSEHDEIILRDQGTLRDKNGDPVIVEVALSRTTFEDLIDDLLDRTLECCEEALTKAHQKSGVTIEQVDHILLVGGSTYVPAVIAKVTQAFCSDAIDRGRPRSRSTAPIRDEPETAVALGAALRAAASGLGVGDDDGCVRLWFRGSGVTKREQATISGYVEPLRPDAALEDGQLRLTTITGDLLEEVALRPGLRFTFRQVAIQAESLNEFKFELWDNSGELVTVLKRTVVHTSDHNETVGHALSTAVLAKPILLDGTDGDRLVRQVLLPEGTSLPAKAQFTFAVADSHGRLRLPIYQENRIIKELQAEIGEVAVGTPVDVEIACDEQVQIQVQFSLGMQTFGGKIEPPPPDTVPTEHEIQQIDARFREILHHLDAEDVRRLSNAYQRIYQDLDEARSGADYPKVVQRAADLEGLIREARLSEPLQPPLETVEKNFASCLELLPQAAQIKPDLAVSSLQHDLEIALDQSRQAYKRRDYQAYDDASKTIGTSLQFLASVTRVRITEDQHLDAAVRAVIALEQARQVTQLVLINCLSGGPRGFLADLNQQLEEIEHLEEDVDTDPVGVLNRCQVMMTEARRIYQQISPEDKRGADLEGLLRVDAQPQTNDIEIPQGLFDQR